MNFRQNKRFYSISQERQTKWIFLPSYVCRRYQARCVKFETLEQSLSKWLMWVKQCQTWKSISFSAVTIPGSKQVTCTVKWKEWIRVSSHICQQVPWKWYEISIVIFFYCHYPKWLRGNYTRHQTNEVWWITWEAEYWEKLRSLI